MLVLVLLFQLLPAIEPLLATGSDKTCGKTGDGTSTYAEKWFSPLVQGGKLPATTMHKMRKITATGCPNHVTTHNALMQDHTFIVPAFPQFDAKFAVLKVDLSASQLPAGVAFNGVAIFSAYPGVGTTSKFNNVVTAHGADFDSCGGYADSASVYRYQVPPTCLLSQLPNAGTSAKHSPQVGWAIDGFPLYGPLGPDGIHMLPCTHTDAHPIICLDECNGYSAELGMLADNIDNFQYRYYISGDGAANPSDYFPYTPLCIRGCCPYGVADCDTRMNECNVNAKFGWNRDYTPQLKGAVTDVVPTPVPTPAATLMIYGPVMPPGIPQACKMLTLLDARAASCSDLHADCCSDYMHCMQVIKNMHAYDSLLNLKTTAELRSHLIPKCFPFSHDYTVNVVPHPGGSPDMLLTNQVKAFSIDGQVAARLRSYPGHAMKFDLSHPSNRHFTMSFSTTPDGTHTSGGFEITNPPAGERGATHTVTVAGSKFVVDGTSQPSLQLSVHPFGSATYTFLQDDTTNTGHQIRFSTVPDGTHNAGTQYISADIETVGTPGAAGAQTRITVHGTGTNGALGTPDLYYYCAYHPGMGGKASTPNTDAASTLILVPPPRTSLRGATVAVSLTPPPTPPPTPLLVHSEGTPGEKDSYVVLYTSPSLPSAVHYFAVEQPDMGGVVVNPLLVGDTEYGCNCQQAWTHMGKEYAGCAQSTDASDVASLSWCIVDGSCGMSGIDMEWGHLTGTGRHSPALELSQRTLYWDVCKTDAPAGSWGGSGGAEATIAATAYSANAAANLAAVQAAAANHRHGDTYSVSLVQKVTDYVKSILTRDGITHYDLEGQGVDYEIDGHPMRAIAFGDWTKSTDVQGGSLKSGADSGDPAHRTLDVGVHRRQVEGAYNQVSRLTFLSHSTHIPLTLLSHSSHTLHPWSHTPLTFLSHSSHPWSHIPLTPLSHSSHPSHTFLTLPSPMVSHPSHTPLTPLSHSSHTPQNTHVLQLHLIEPNEFLSAKIEM
jgi:hypothetical protein